MDARSAAGCRVRRVEEGLDRCGGELRVGDVSITQGVASIADALEAGDERRARLELLAIQLAKPCDHGERRETLRRRRPLVDPPVSGSRADGFDPVRAMRGQLASPDEP